MLEHLMDGTDMTKITIDDVEHSWLAKIDLELFLEMHPLPILINY